MRVARGQHREDGRRIDAGNVTGTKKKELMKKEKQSIAEQKAEETRQVLIKMGLIKNG